MASRTKEQLDWTDVDVATLPKKAGGLYNKYKTLARDAAIAREEFNAEFIRSLSAKVNYDPDENHVVVGHNFGKLSFALASGPAEGPRGKKTAFSFK